MYDNHQISHTLQWINIVKFIRHSVLLVPIFHRMGNISLWIKCFKFTFFKNVIFYSFENAALGLRANENEQILLRKYSWYKFYKNWLNHSLWINEFDVNECQFCDKCLLINKSLALRETDWKLLHWKTHLEWHKATAVKEPTEFEFLLIVMSYKTIWINLSSQKGNVIQVKSSTRRRSRLNSEEESLWRCGLCSWLRHHSKRVRTPVMLLRSLSD